MQSSTQITTVHVELSERSYDIQIGSGLLSNAAHWVRSLLNTSHLVLITDDNVDSLYADALADQFLEDGFDVNLMTIEAGEPSKSPELIFELWEAMLASATDRQSTVIAVGGGVVGDAAGFAAATYARGLPFLQIPTTLLAQVDSSVGGKTGVNLPDAKNMVGAFWQPRGVLIDVDVLGTLPEREFIAGLGEVVKYGVILDKEFFAYLEENIEPILQRDAQTLQHIVARSCQLKADIVQQDEREESGVRSYLNYGHTFGHALEAITNYNTLLHGEGVAIGMQCAARLAERLGRIGTDVVDRQEKLLKALGLPVDMPDVDLTEVLKLMRMDKKVASGEMRFVLPTRLGEVELVTDVPIEDIQASLRPINA